MIVIYEFNVHDIENESELGDAEVKKKGFLKTAASSSSSHVL